MQITKMSIQKGHVFMQILLNFISYVINRSSTHLELKSRNVEHDKIDLVITSKIKSRVQIWLLIQKAPKINHNN